MRRASVLTVSPTAVRFAQVAAVALAVVAPAVLVAQRPLDHDAYDIWRSIDDEVIAPNGRWVAYALTLERGDPELRVREARGETEYTIARGREPAFSADGRFVVFAIKPAVDSVRAARRAKAKPADMPKDSLGILDLTTGDVLRVPRVRSFRVPEDAGAWVAYLLEREPAAGDTAAPGDSARAEPADSTVKPKKDSEVGTPLVLRRLATGEDYRYAHVTRYAFAEGGGALALTVSSKTGDEDGVLVVPLGGDVGQTRILGGRGTYTSLRFDSAGTQLAFLTDRDEAAEDHPRYALYHWRTGSASARRVAAAGMAGVPQGWTVSEHRAPEFSDGGGRVYFGTAPWMEPPPEDSTLEEDRVDVDVWHWRDAALQPQQLIEADRERRRSYLAVLHVADGRIVQLATEDVPDVRLGDGDANFVVGESELPYAVERSWDFPTYRDLYAVDVRSGARRLVAERQQDRLFLSPDGRYALWFDRAAQAWMTRATAGGPVTNASAGVPVPLVNEQHDWPYPPDPYGLAMWASDSRWFVVYDRYDLWALDALGRGAPRNITDGVGRREHIRFRYARVDGEQRSIPVDRPLLLSAFDTDDKRAGFYREQWIGVRPPARLLLAERRFSTPVRAVGADALLYTAESVEAFPDLWVADAAFETPRRVSDANPQQSGYRWATVELISWMSADGTTLEGLVYKPADFDTTRTYPMMVTFYERNSDNRYAHHPARPHRSVIRPTFYASRGYIVFVPDIVYRVGYPGQSAVDAVTSGVQDVVRRGYVDPARIGVQGHSWGGYQIAFLVTRTSLFRAAAAGAPVANMTSAYGGIRWGSGLSRMFQYERTQSRLGGSLWEMPLRYLENSPLFWADRVRTPLLILHNDHDTAVPWEQGIELFVALRRLGKPVWLINYNGEPHWPLPFPKRRDWNIRMQQYFDHYLMDAPAPRWLAEGIPAVEKGRTLGLELVGEAGR